MRFFFFVLRVIIYPCLSSDCCMKGKKPHTEVFHVTCQVTNQRERLQEESSPLSSLCWWMDFTTGVFLLVACRGENRVRGSRLASLRLSERSLFREVFPGVRSQSSPNQPVRGHGRVKSTVHLSKRSNRTLHQICKVSGVLLSNKFSCFSFFFF